MKAGLDLDARDGVDGIGARELHKILLRDGAIAVTQESRDALFPRQS